LVTYVEFTDRQVIDEALAGPDHGYPLLRAFQESLSWRA